VVRAPRKTGVMRAVRFVLVHVDDAPHFFTEHAAIRLIAPSPFS
jgi:hypothetical protein